MNSLGAWFQNLLFNRKRYRVHQDAVIISCFYNPQGNPYRLLAFQKWYRSIKHVPHRIVECLIGPHARSQLPSSPYITQVRSDSMLWHKESLLNMIVRDLPEEFKYVFWVDADVLFTNLDWIRDSVEALQKANIIQPFDYCVHLKRNQLKPDFNVDYTRFDATNPKLKHPQIWQSFCSVHSIAPDTSSSDNYDRHGHVGFAWGARREILDQCPLYDRCLIGGGDHIIAHAAAGHLPHNCIQRVFAGDIEAVEQWSKSFNLLVRGKVGYIHGDLYHIWHGDLKARDYYRTVQAYTRQSGKIKERDKNGLFVAEDKDEFVKRHYARREARRLSLEGDFNDSDAEFFADMGYHLLDLLELFGQPTYSDPVDGEPNLGDADLNVVESVPMTTQVEVSGVVPGSTLTGVEDNCCQLPIGDQSNMFS